MAVDFENMSKILAIVIVTVNLGLMGIATNMIDSQGNPVAFISTNVDSVYDANSLVSDVNALNLGDVNNLQSFVSTSDPSNPVANLTMALTSFSQIGGLLYNMFFFIQSYINYFFSAIGLIEVGWILIAPLTMIELFGLFKLALGFFSVLRGGGGL